MKVVINLKINFFKPENISTTSPSSTNVVSAERIMQRESENIVDLVLVINIIFDWKVALMRQIISN